MSLLPRLVTRENRRDLAFPAAELSSPHTPTAQIQRCGSEPSRLPGFGACASPLSPRKITWGSPVQQAWFPRRALIG